MLRKLRITMKFIAVETWEFHVKETKNNSEVYRQVN